MLRRLCILLIASAVVACSRSNPDRAMTEAEALVGLGDSAGALTLYEQAARHCPGYARCAEALLRAGDIRANAGGETDGSLENYQHIIDFFPLTEAARIAHERRARVFERQGEYLGAADEYARLLQHFPRHESASRYLLRLGEAYLALGNIAQARIEFDGLLAADGVADDIRQEALFAYAEGFFLEGRLGLAEESYQKLIDQYPDSRLAPEARMKIATCQEERGFLGDAVRTMEGARESYPNTNAIDGRLKAMSERGKGAPPKEIIEMKAGKDDENGGG